MTSRTLLLSTLVATIPLSEPSTAAPVIDQSHPAVQTIGGIITFTDFELGQTFTAGLPGLLSQVGVELGRDAGTINDVTVQIRSTVAGVPTLGPPLAERTISIESIPETGPTDSIPFSVVDVSAAGILVEPGDELAIVIAREGESDGPTVFWNRGNPPYDAGLPFRHFVAQDWAAFSSGTDFAFQTWVDSIGQGIVNGDFETGNLTGWNPFNTPNGNTFAGFPSVFPFDVTGDGNASPAAKLRVGSDEPDDDRPAGGGIEQTFLVAEAGDFELSADIAVTLEQNFGNTGPGKFDLLFDGAVVDSIDYNGTLIEPGDVFRNRLSATLTDLEEGIHSVAVQVLRSASNTRDVYQYFDNIRLLPVAVISADFDADGDVDGDDFLLWQAGFGMVDANRQDGDADGDGDVDGDDFLLWQAQFGDGPGGDAASAVPEPAHAACVLLALLLVRRSTGSCSVAGGV